MTLPTYCTLQDIKDAMPDNAVSTTSQYDTLVNEVIARTSRNFDKFTKRKPGAFAVSADVTRYFDGPSQGVYSPVYGFKAERLTSGYTGAISLYVGELAAFPTSVSVAETGQVDTGPSNTGGNYTLWPTSDYYPEPQNALDDGLPYGVLTLDILYGTHRIWYPFKRGIKIVGRFGYSTTPPDDVKQGVILMTVRLLRKAQQNYQNVATINDVGQIMQGDKVDTDITDTLEHYGRMTI